MRGKSHKEGKQRIEFKKKKREDDKNAQDNDKKGVTGQGVNTDISKFQREPQKGGMKYQ